MWVFSFFGESLDRPGICQKEETKERRRESGYNKLFYPSFRTLCVLAHLPRPRRPRPIIQVRSKTTNKSRAEGEMSHLWSVVQNRCVECYSRRDKPWWGRQTRLVGGCRLVWVDLHMCRWDEGAVHTAGNGGMGETWGCRMCLPGVRSFACILAAGLVFDMREHIHVSYETQVDKSVHPFCYTTLIHYSFLCSCLAWLWKTLALLFFSSFTFHVSTFDSRVSSPPQPDLRHAESCSSGSNEKKSARGLSASLSELLQWAGFASWVFM